MVLISSDPINPAESYGLIGKNGSGSVLFHYAVVKENSGNGRATACIEFRPGENIEEELHAIAATIKERWNLVDLLLVRRVGCLEIGEIISLVAASSPNSEDAFAACRDAITLLKKMKTMKKQEIYR